MNSGSASRSAADAPQRPQRPRELQDPLNYYLYHPLAWQLARLLARTPLTPNMVSVMGAMMVVAAGLSYTQLAWPVSAALGMALHMSWHVVDGADGDLARLTGRASPIGEMVDGLCDYLSHVVLYVLLGFWLQAHGGEFAGWHAWALVVFAGVSHAFQSNHVEVQRRQYQYWVYGTPWIRQSHQPGSETAKSGFSALVTLYINAATSMTPYALKVDEAVVAAAGDPARRRLVRGPAGPPLQSTHSPGPGSGRRPADARGPPLRFHRRNRSQRRATGSRPWQRRIPASGAPEFFADRGMRFDDEIQHAAAVAANGPADEDHDRLKRNQSHARRESDSSRIEDAARPLARRHQIRRPRRWIAAARSHRW